jgi:hypothetical protein
MTVRIVISIHVYKPTRLPHTYIIDVIVVVVSQLSVLVTLLSKPLSDSRRQLHKIIQTTGKYCLNSKLLYQAATVRITVQ